MFLACVLVCFGSCVLFSKAMSENQEIPVSFQSVRQNLDSMNDDTKMGCTKMNQGLAIAVPDDPSSYIYCGPMGKWESASCPSLSINRRTIFDAKTSSCVAWSPYTNPFLLSKIQLSQHRKVKRKTQCDRGAEPLTLSCTSSSQCPDRYECKENVCCPSKYRICSQQVPAASGSLSTKRFWYDIFSGKCHEILFHGTDVIANNFPTQTECEDYCKGIKWTAKCPKGNPMMAERGQLQQCAAAPGKVPPRALTYCEKKFECYNHEEESYVCCPMRRCPDGKPPAMDRTTFSSMKCSPLVSGACPGSTRCTADPQTKTHMCCKSMDITACPPDSSIALYEGLPKFCSEMGSDSQRKKREVGGCPGDNRCFLAHGLKLPNNQGICCSKFTPTLSCPAGQTETVSESKKQLLCSAKTQDGCPKDSTCKAEPSATYGICCSADKTPTCSTGEPWRGKLKFVPQCSVNGLLPEYALTECPEDHDCGPAKNNPQLMICCPKKNQQP